MTTKTQETQRVLEVRPPADVAATQEGVYVSLEMPGAIGDSVSVIVDDDTLIVTADRVSRIDDTRLLHRESRPGSYERSFRLSKDLDRDGLHADYRLGVLSIFIPRAEHTIPRKIEVRTAD